MHILSGRRCGHVSTPPIAGGVDTSHITDIIKHCLFQVWGHKGDCNNISVIWRFFFSPFYSEHLVVLWMHTYWTRMAWGGITFLIPAVLKPLNDKLIYTGRRRNDSNDNMTLYKEESAPVEVWDQVRYRSAPLQLKTPLFNLPPRLKSVLLWLRSHPRMLPLLWWTKVGRRSSGGLDPHAELNTEPQLVIVAVSQFRLCNRLLFKGETCYNKKQ